MEEEWPGDVVEYWRSNALEGTWSSGLYPSVLDARHIGWLGALLDEIAGRPAQSVLELPRGRDHDSIVE